MCPICQGQDRLYLDYRQINKGDYQLRRCSSCRAIFTKPLPSADFLHEFYQHYDSIGRTDNYYQDIKNYRHRAMGRQLIDLFNKLNRQYHFRHDLRLLDLGSGGGMFLDIIKRAGFSGLGVEVSAPAVSFAQDNFSVDCLAADVASVDFDEQFGAVFMWDLLEHLPRPGLLLDKINNWLAPGAYLIIETPNSQALINQLILWLLKIGIRWPAGWMFGYHHLFWHSRKSLEVLLAKSGFRILQLSRSNTQPRRVFPWSIKFFLPRLALEALNLLAVIVGRQNKLLIIAQKL
ncbi:MAG TPA: class I SAM-dependent methyltransferase [bacterium]|nr:class I SAM-dependent methyltransferase [bacterium]